MHPLKPRLQNLSALNCESQCLCGKTKALLPPGGTHTPHTGRHAIHKHVATSTLMHIHPCIRACLWACVHIRLHIICKCFRHLHMNAGMCVNAHTRALTL